MQTSAQQRRNPAGDDTAAIGSAVSKMVLRLSDAGSRTCLLMTFCPPSLHGLCCNFCALVLAALVSAGALVVVFVAAHVHVNKNAYYGACCFQASAISFCLLPFMQSPADQQLSPVHLPPCNTYSCICPASVDPASTLSSRSHRARSAVSNVSNAWRYLDVGPMISVSCLWTALGCASAPLSVLLPTSFACFAAPSCAAVSASSTAMPFPRTCTAYA